jgi:hypothetical protein
MLDAQGGSPAELVYPKLGYIRVSNIIRHDILLLKLTLNRWVLFRMK